MTANPFVAEPPNPFITDPPPPRVITVQAPPGAGKTRKIRELITPYLQAGKKVVLAVPRHKLGDEIVAAFAAEGITARVYRGRDAGDPEAGGDIKMCRDLDRVKLIEEAGGRVSSDACRYQSPVEYFQCKFYDTCGYQRQRRAKPDIWIIPHQLLFKMRREFIPEPDLLVIDEAFWGATLHGTDRPYKVPVADLLAVRDVPLFPSLTADLLAISRKVHAVAVNTIGRLRRADLVAAGVTAGDIREAHKWEWMRKIELPKGLPGTSLENLKDICRRIEHHNRQLFRLARLWKLLIQTMDAADELSPWVEVRAEPNRTSRGWQRRRISSSPGAMKFIKVGLSRRSYWMRRYAPRSSDHSIEGRRSSRQNGSPCRTFLCARSAIPRSQLVNSFRRKVPLNMRTSGATTTWNASVGMSRSGPIASTPARWS